MYKPFKKRVLIILLNFALLLMLLTACGGGGNSFSTNQSDNKTRSWTVMIYMDGDNNLSGATSLNLSWMEEVGSTTKVAIVAEVDTSTGPTERYYIEKGKAKLIGDLGELDMADNRTLADFGKWAISSYPAKHYLLILWDHGNGFRTSTSNKKRDIFVDDNVGSDNISVMTIPQLKAGLVDIEEKLGKKIDIIGFDACLMGMTEIAYELRSTAYIMIASENTEPYDGWPYNRFLSELVNNPYVSGEDLSKYIIDSYINYYGSGSNLTLSAINLDNITHLCRTFNNLSNALIEDNYSKSIFQNDILPNVQRVDENTDGSISLNDSYVDLYDLVDLIHKDDNFSEVILDNASLVKKAFRDVIVYNRNTGLDVSKTYGLTIWLPDNNSFDNSTIEKYKTLDFCKDYSGWLNFLYFLNK